MSTKRKNASRPSTPKACRCRRFITHETLLADVRRIRARGDDPIVWPFFAMVSCDCITKDPTLVHTTIAVDIDLRTNADVYNFLSFALLNTCTELQDIIEKIEKADPQKTRTKAIKEIQAMNTLVARACENAKEAGVSDEFRRAAYSASLRLDEVIEKMKLRQTVLFLCKDHPPFAVVRSAMLLAIGRPDDATATRVDKA